jgi:predicted MPP superfamily phosphohydrolase
MAVALEAVVYVTLLLMAHLGHAALWVGLVNRIHSTGMPRWAVKWLSLMCLGAVIVIPLILGAVTLWADTSNAASKSAESLPVTYWRQGIYYFVPCIAIFLAAAVVWVKRQITYRPPAALRSLRREQLDVAEELGFVPLHGRFARFCGRLPGNQLFCVSVEEREIEFSRLPLVLDGASIVHLSDFHFTGRVAKEYFQEVVRRANELQPDLVAITGDLVDHAPYIDWLPETLGRLRAEAGVFCIFGNHDLRTSDVDRLRRTLADCGLVYLGARWQKVDLRGESLILAGNELPWIAPAADMRTCVAAAVGMEHDRPFRILLSHSPDQFGWAQRWDFDLMLAGHTHGGQFRLPWIGPFLTPCWHGVKYSCGTFVEGPTVMHVSRGISSELPFRLNCPPEINKIVLRAAGASVLASGAA